MPLLNAGALGSTVLDRNYGALGMNSLTESIRDSALGYDYGGFTFGPFDDDIGALTSDYFGDSGGESPGFYEELQSAGPGDGFVPLSGLDYCV